MTSMMLRWLNWEYATKKWLFVDHWYGWLVLLPPLLAWAALLLPLLRAPKSGS